MPISTAADVSSAAAAEVSEGVSVAEGVSDEVAVGRSDFVASVSLGSPMVSKVKF